MRAENAITSWICSALKGLHFHFEQMKLTCNTSLTLLRFLPIYNNIFPVIDQCNFFLIFGPDIPIDVLTYIFFILAHWVLFHFWLSKKERFLVWSYTEKVSFISLHGGTCFRYSEINNQRLIIPKNKESNKKCRFQRQLPVSGGCLL